MTSQEALIREQYLNRLSEVTLRVGKLTAMVGIPVIVFFAIQDYLALGMANVWGWRMAGFLPWAVFLSLILVKSFQVKKNLIVPVHMVALFGTMVMMAGITFVIFEPGAATPQNKFGVIAGYIAAIACVFLVSAGARQYLPWLISLPLVVLLLGLLFLGNLDPSDWLFVSNVVLIAVFASILAIRQEKVYFREFSSRMLLEIRENELEKEVVLRKQVEEELRKYQGQLEYLVTQRTAELEVANKELALAKEEAESMNRLKSHFLANVSHEIRTPINGILGIAQILRDETNPEEVLEYADMLNTSGQRLLRTLSSIISLSKLESTTFEFEYEWVNLHELIQREMALFSSEAELKGISLEVEEKNTHLKVLVDHEVLQEILNSLLDNAVKFTHQGGVKVSYHTLADENLVSIKVQDSGIGIEATTIPELFSAFRQENEGLTRASEGMGIGLNLVHRYVELLQGSLSVNSEKGKGSTFEVMLPLEQIAAPA